MFRRALTDEELDSYESLGVDAASLHSDFLTGIKWIITAMLQSPHFLYMPEVGVAVEGKPERRRLSGYEIATRMSYFLLDAPPTDALLQRAENGELDTRQGIEQAAREMVDSQAARHATASFFEEYFDLGGIEEIPKDPNLFPTFSAELAASMKEETMLLIDDIAYVRETSMLEMFTADYSFVDDNLAVHYDVAAPHNAAWTKTSFPIEQRRAGVLGHASIASIQAHTDSTSVTFRGLFVSERFLCTTMPPPPEDVVTELPPSSTAPTMRERVAIHLEVESCASCHQISDPIGLSLENLDPIGRWRDKEQGVTIDATAEHYQIGAFDGITGLGTALAASPEVAECMTRQLYRYATGHVETQEEVPQLERISELFRNADHRFKELLVELVASDVYRFIATPAEETEGAP